MKVSILLLLFATSIVPVLAETKRLSKPVLVDAKSETFGKVLDASLAKVDLNQLLNKPNKYLGKPVQMQVGVSKVCQKKGCFFIAQDGEQTIRVSFRDYGFFVPTDSAGKKVTLNGELIQKEMTAKQAAHYKSDLRSQSAEIKAGMVYEFVADGVKIPLVAQQQE